MDNPALVDDFFGLLNRGPTVFAFSGSKKFKSRNTIFLESCSRKIRLYEGSDGSNFFRSMKLSIYMKKID